MKNLTALLQKGNLSPKERVLLWVHNVVNKDKTGKEILTEADKHALSEGWTPKDNYEVKEYNRYNDGWKNAVFAEIDAQITYFAATNNLLRAGRLIDMILLKNEKHTLGFYKDFIKEHFESEDDALEIVIKNSGLEFDSLVHRYAFESLSEDLKSDILALDPDAKTESQYLDQEEVIADSFNGKNTLSKETKEKLADLMVENLYFEYGKDWRFDSYFAEIPAIEILKKWADYNKINYEISDSDLEEAEKKQREARNASQLIAGDKSLDKDIRKENCGFN